MEPQHSPQFPLVSTFALIAATLALAGVAYLLAIDYWDRDKIAEPIDNPENLHVLEQRITKIEEDFSHFERLIFISSTSKEYDICGKTLMVKEVTIKGMDIVARIAEVEMRNENARSLCKSDAFLEKNEGDELELEVRRLDPLIGGNVYAFTTGQTRYYVNADRMQLTYNVDPFAGLDQSVADL